MKKIAFLLMIVMAISLFAGCARSADTVTLNVLNWGDYIDEELITRFEDETGIKINYTTLANNEEMLVKLQQEDCIYDLCFPSDYIIEKLIGMDLLHEKYGICEDDFTSAELEVVPAFNATDLGLDRSLIGAYGHDDRVCGYAALKGLFDIDVPEKTAVCMLADKEEVGSMGVTGMQSAFFDTFMEDLCQSQGVSLRVCYESSFCLSSDVTAAYDPNFAEVYEKRNESRVNYGLGICKYTGARGKGGSSDADAETVAYVRRVLDNAGVVWQIGEMGKIDAGGGGTVAQYMANRNIATLDAGVPVLSMHAPFEVVAKLDCYETYRACKAIYEAE